jgi:hypothetical protein
MLKFNTSLTPVENNYRNVLSLDLSLSQFMKTSTAATVLLHIYGIQKIFFLLQTSTMTGAHPASYVWITRTSFPRRKMAMV